MASFLRKSFLLYGPLAVQDLPGSAGNGDNDEAPLVTDATMPVDVAAARKSTQGLRFPSDFLWGAATAAYQIEGGLDDCNWSQWEKRGHRSDGRPTVEHHQKAGRACNAWETLGADLDALKRLGATMYRFSVEWSRVEPARGEFDEEALERYGSFCRRLRDAGIEPMITLHHFTEPSWFVEEGGWEERGNLRHFRRFAEHATRRLAPHCRYWTTINEPNGYVVCGWLAGVHPPGKVNDLFAMLTVFRHLLVAHTIASQAMRAAFTLQPESPIICLALNHVYFLPFDPGQHPRPDNLLALSGWILNLLLSKLVSLFLNYVYNFVLLDGIFAGGRFPNFPFPFQLAASLCGWGDDIAALKNSSDWIGINHYYRSYVQFGIARASGEGRRKQASPTDMFVALPFGIELRAAAVANFEKNEMGWDLTPSSMIRLLDIVADRYPQTPIIVTESGTADSTDRKRVRYIASLLVQMHALLHRQNRVDLRGYLIWTLMDNFEWAEGFRPKFGLLETDFRTFRRKERPGTCDMLRSVFGKSSLVK